MKNPEDIINKIQQAKIDTRYVLDGEVPVRGVKRVLGVWLISYIIASLIIYFSTQYFMSLYITDGFDGFEITRLITFALFTVVIAIYYICLLRTSMTMKEKDFLKVFSIFIVLFSLLRMLFPLSYYMNFTVLLQLYNTFPFDIVINMIALIFLFNYLKDKTAFISIGMNIIFVALMTYVFSIIMNSSELSGTLLSLNDMLVVLRDNGIIIIVSLFTIILSMKHRKVEI